jgi:hypothetical protein
MPYEAEISRANPGCIVFLVDQSESMQEPIGDDYKGQKKCQVVANEINKMIANIVIICTKSGETRSYFNVGVVGYGLTVGSAFTIPLKERDLIPVNEIGENILRIDTHIKIYQDSTGNLVTQEAKLPIWLDPIAVGPTQMCAALGKAQQVLTSWIKDHPRAYPPMVFNISGSSPTDGDPTSIAHALMNLCIEDGNVQLFNSYFSSKTNVIFCPSDENMLTDDIAKKLFRISSVVPRTLRYNAQNAGYAVNDQSHCFSQNLLVEMFKFILRY